MNWENYSVYMGGRSVPAAPRTRCCPSVLASVCAYNGSYTGELVQGLFDAHYTQPPYAAFYPDIVSTLQVRGGGGGRGDDGGEG